MSVAAGDQGGRQDDPIELLDLSARGYNILKRSGIETVGQLLALDRQSLLGLRNLNRATYEEIRLRVIAHGHMTADQPPGPFREDEVAP